MSISKKYENIYPRLNERGKYEGIPYYRFIDSSGIYGRVR
jgi:hypothetical protein